MKKLCNNEEHATYPEINGYGYKIEGFPHSIGCNDHLPTCCNVCGKKPVVVCKQSIMGQILFGLCRDHSHYGVFMGNGKMGVCDPNVED
jgi:hypothetical protein